MKAGRHSHQLSDPFTDLLFNALLGFTLLFFISILFMNPIARLGNINYKAEYIITVSWPQNQPDDIDLAFKEYRLYKFISKPWDEDELRKLILDAIKAANA